MNIHWGIKNFLEGQLTGLYNQPNFSRKKGGGGLDQHHHRNCDVSHCVTINERFCSIHIHDMNNKNFQFSLNFIN